MRQISSFVVVLAALYLPNAFAQGPDCSNPVVISGVGNWDFNAVGGASGLPAPSCAPSTAIDSFYQWSALVPGVYSFEVRNPQYDGAAQFLLGGDCNAVQIECSPGIQAGYGAFGFLEIQQAGVPYLIRSLGFQNSSEIRIRWVGPTCQVLVDDVFEPNDNCHEAPTIPNGVYTDLVLTDREGSPLDHYRFGVAPGGTLRVEVDTPNLTVVEKVVMALWLDDPAEVECDLAHATQYEFSQGEPLPPIEYTNTGTSTQFVVLGVSRKYFGITNTWVGCVEYDMTITGADTTGGLSDVTTFCDPMDPNSTGLPTIASAFQGTGTGSGIRLMARQGPPGQFASFVVGTGLSEPGIVLGQGRFCLSQAPGQQFGRYNVANSVFNSIGRFDAGGHFQNLVGTSQSGYGFDVPTALPGFGLSIQPGDTWHYQMWSRDVGGSSTWSNGISVNFFTVP